jgi:hypothetical protein
MDQGKDKTKAGDLASALDAYQKAHDLMRVPTTGLALAKAHVSMAHLVEARDVALEVTRMPREPGEPPVFEQSRQKAKALEASLKPRIPMVKIAVKGGPATSIAVDGVDVAPSLLGLPVAVNPGKRVVLVKNADGVERRAEIVVAEKETKDVELDLPPPAPPVAATASPARPSAAPADTRGERTGLANVLAFGGFGLAVVGLAAGSVTGVMAMSQADSVKAQCERDICDPAAESDLAGARSMATLSTFAFAVGGAGLVLGSVGLLLPRSSAAPRTGFWIGPGAAGVRGSF